MFTFTQWLNDFLVKAAGHKYIKRIPYQSGGKLRYRYIYNVTHTHAGKHILDPDHMKVGTKLMLDATSGKEVHGHITAVSGDKVTFVFDDGPRKGKALTMSKERLAAGLDKVHGISGKLSEARAKQKATVDKLKERGASDKQIAREQKRLYALEGLDALGRKINREEANREKQFARLLSETEPNNVRLSNIVTVADMKQKLRPVERLKRVRPFGVAGETNPDWSRMLKRPLDSEANRALMRERVAIELGDYIHGVEVDAKQGMREVDQDLKVMRYSLNSAEKRASDEAISEFRQAYQQRYDDLFYQNVERTEGEALDAIRSKVLEGAPEWAKEVFEEEYRSRMSTPNVPSRALKEPTAVFKGGFTFSEWASALADKAEQ